MVTQSSGSDHVVIRILESIPHKTNNSYLHYIVFKMKSLHYFQIHIKHWSKLTTTF